MIPKKAQWKKWSLPSKLTAISAYVTVIMALLYFIDKAAQGSNPQGKTVLKDSTVTPVLLVKGVVTLDDLNWDNVDSLSLAAQYCDFIDKERISLKNVTFKNEKQYLNWVIEKYFGNNLASKDFIKISSTDNGDLGIKIVTTDSLDFPEKNIQVSLNSKLKGKLDNNDNIDYVIPFYTSGGGNYYYCQLLFIINDFDSVRVFRNCGIELSNFKFSPLTIDKRILKIVTYNHNEDDAWINPTHIDTIKLKYFNGKMIFTD